MNGISNENGRFLSGAYDSIHQSSTLEKRYGIESLVEESKDLDQALEEYIGRLRLDSFLCNDVVLTDAQIFDGTFFLNVATSNRFEDLPCDQIEIMSRSENPEEALLGFVVDEGEDFLKPFEFSFLPPREEIREEVRKGLSKTRRSEIGDWQQLIGKLREFHIGDETADQLHEAWARWIEAIRNKKIRFRAWNKWSQSEWHSLLELVLQANKSDYQSVLTDEGKQLLENVWETKFQKRSNITSMLRKTRTNAMGGGNFELARDVDTVETWFNKAYNDVAAVQHRCNFTEPDELPMAKPVEYIQRVFDQLRNEPAKSHAGFGISDDRKAALPANFIRSLGKMDGKLLSAVRSEHTNYIQAWIESENNFDKLRHVVDKLVLSIDTSVGFDVQFTQTRYLSGLTKVFSSLSPAWAGIAGGVAGYSMTALVFDDTLAQIASGTASGLVGAGIPPIAKMGDKHVQQNEVLGRSIVRRAKSIRQ